MASSPVDPLSKQPLFNMSINLGSVLTIIAMIVSIVLAYGAISGRILLLEQEVSQLELKVDAMSLKITDMSYQQGRQEQKLEDERQGSGK